MRYMLESRWPQWARWRPVTAAPHSERWPVDPQTRRLVFDSAAMAEQAAEGMRRANAGEFRVVETA